MSTIPPATTPALVPPPVRTVRKRRFPLVRVILGGLVLSVASLLEPHCFRFAVAHLVRLEAWRNGVRVQLHKVEGSLYEPVTLRDSVWIYESVHGPISRLQVTTARAVFSWRDLFSRGAAPWFRQLEVEGLIGKIEFPIEAPTVAPRQNRLQMLLPQGRWLRGPERIEARDVNLIFQSNGDYVRLEGAEFTVSEVEPGRIAVQRLAIKQPWLNRTFHRVQGATKLDQAKAEFAAVALEPGVQIQSLAAGLTQLARGELNLKMHLAAFGGDLRIETRTLPGEKQLTFEATGDFSQIAIGQLATFLGVSDAAGGTIKKGTFTFRGAPQNPANAFARVRVDAANFQWDSRQWDSLVLGATLMDGRVQIPELTLLQGHNYVTLNGAFALPGPRQQWWQNEFAFNVAAKIENLTELSALMLPEFKYAAGKATIDGAVRGRNQQFDGQLIVAGSDLTWRSAPIDDLHATLKLAGNELQLTNLSIFNDGDYVRGRGVVNILGDKQYWGELRASIDDLGKYAALLQKPIVPEPLAGGAVLQWSGEGSARGQSGKFLARLRKVRSLGASATRLHPINADLEGTYAPGSMLFSQFGLSDDESSFTANVAVGNKALSLQNLRFVHGRSLELEGNALLPLDVWKAWPNTSLETLLDDSTVAHVALQAHALDLHAFARLSGFVFPIEGVVTGDIAVDGPLGAIESSGKLALAGAVIPLGWTGVLLTGVEGQATLAGQTLGLAQLSGRHPTGDFQIAGSIDFTRLRDPALQLAVTSNRTDLVLFRTAAADQQVDASFGLKLDVAGPASAASVSGAAPLRWVSMGSLTDATALLFRDESLATPEVFTLPSSPWNAWQFDVSCHTENLAAGSQPDVATALRLTGPGAQPVLLGTVRLKDFSAAAGHSTVRIEDALLTFREGFPTDPSLDLKVTGLALGEPFTLYATGTASHLMRFIVCDTPLTPELIRTEFTEPPGDRDPRFSLLSRAALATGAPVFDWAPIPDPPIPPPAPAVETIPAVSPEPGAASP